MHSDLETGQVPATSPDFDLGARIAAHSDQDAVAAGLPRRRSAVRTMGVLILGFVIGGGFVSLWQAGKLSLDPGNVVAMFGSAETESDLTVQASIDSPEVAPSDGERGRILYYRNPMGLPDISPVPKRDSMGMEYIPVYENEVTADDGTIRISPAKIQALGVTTEIAMPRSLRDEVRAFGTVVLDETRVWLITTKIAGWIEELAVAETGVALEKGATLFELFSPELYDLELEYVIAATGAGASGAQDPVIDRVTSAALQRLRNWGVPQYELDRLDSEKTPGRTIRYVAPASGRVLERMGLPGMRIEAGDPIYRMADLSVVWVIAEVDERDLADVSIGGEVEVEVSAFAHERFRGVVTLIYPEIDTDTRRARVRIEIENADERLRPGMLADVIIHATSSGEPVLSVSDSAVLDSGTRQLVFVDLGEGRFQPRAVRLGRSGGGFTEITDGVSPGESVVTGANFLLDSESNLQSALNAFWADTDQSQE